MGNRGKLVKALQTPVSVLLEQIPIHSSRAIGLGMCEGLPACGYVLIALGSYLVDPASSHMLVSKIKPCMCKYELTQNVKLRMAH